MKVYVHEIGRYRMRCPFKDAETALELYSQSIPPALYSVFKIKDFDAETLDLPRINGLGIQFRDQALTLFAEGTDILVLDQDGLKEAADRIPDPSKA